MEPKLATVRGAVKMIITKHTPAGIGFAAIHEQLFLQELEVSNEMLIQALRLEHAECGISPTPHGWVLGTATVLDWGRPPHGSITHPFPYEQTIPDGWKGRWKAKIAGQRSGGYSRLRVEIRKNVSAAGFGAVQVLVVVMRDGAVRVSANGCASYTGREFAELQLAVTEAREALRGYERAHPLPQEAAA